MSDYGRRRWDWAVTQSLQRVRWDSAEAVAVSIAILVVPAGLSLLASGSLDLLWKATLAIAATLVVLGVLVAVNWLRAPAVLDALREAEIAELKARMAEAPDDQYHLPPPYGITQSAAARMFEALRNHKMGVRITLDLGASEARNLFQQVVAVFREAGWATTEFEVLGVKPPSETGVSLFRAPGVGEEQIGAVRTALSLGGIDFNESTVDGDLTVPHIAFSKRDPFWVPPAKWG